MGDAATVVLFDIDGTLILSGGAGRRAMERAFASRTGRADACAGISFAGMTDRAIVRAGLTAIGAAVDEAAIDDLIDAYLAHLHHEVRASPDYRVLDGVAEAVELATAIGCAVGLGTGNVRACAVVKLGRGGLAERFAFGGFGCDAEDRAALLRVGAERGAARLGASPDRCRVVVVGDTPKDVAAARAIGAECLAVATGAFAVDDLAAAGATWAVATLACDHARAVLRGQVPARS